MSDELPFYECYLNWYTDEYMRKFHEFMKWFQEHQHELPPEWFGVPKAFGATTTNPAYIGNVSEAD